MNRKKFAQSMIFIGLHTFLFATNSKAFRNCSKLILLVPFVFTWGKKQEEICPLHSHPKSTGVDQFCTENFQLEAQIPSINVQFPIIFVIVCAKHTAPLQISSPHLLL